MHDSSTVPIPLTPATSMRYDSSRFAKLAYNYILILELQLQTHAMVHLLAKSCDKLHYILYVFFFLIYLFFNISMSCLLIGRPSSRALHALPVIEAMWNTPLN